jgi:hypothetical protein
MPEKRTMTSDEVRAMKPSLMDNPPGVTKPAGRRTMSSAAVAERVGLGGARGVPKAKPAPAKEAPPPPAKTKARR